MMNISVRPQKDDANLCAGCHTHLRLTGFVLQTDPGTKPVLCYGASFTFHFKTRRMYVFVHGLYSDLMEQLICNVSNHSNSLETFFLLPSMILELNLQGTLRAIDSWHKDIYKMECKTGVRWDAEEQNLEGLDLAALTRDINSATANLAYWTLACRTYQSMLDFLDEIARQYRTQAILNGLSEEHGVHIETLLLERHAYLRSWAAGMERRVDFLSKRAQAQVQTVRHHRLISPW